MNSELDYASSGRDRREGWLGSHCCVLGQEALLTVRLSTQDYRWCVGYFNPGENLHAQERLLILMVMLMFLLVLMLVLLLLCLQHKKKGYVRSSYVCPCSCIVAQLSTIACGYILVMCL